MQKILQAWKTTKNFSGQHSTQLKFFVWALQTLDLQVHEELQRHSPCISQSHRLSVPDVASHPHDASVMFLLLLKMI
jgi:hypothetical protein